MFKLVSFKSLFRITKHAAGKYICKNIFFISFFFVQSSFGQCDQTAGPNNPATAADQSFSGSNYSFVNTSNIFTSNNVYATSTAVFTLFVLTGKTDYLAATNFNFSIPIGASVCGISVAIEKSGTSLVNLVSSIVDYKVSLLKNNVVVGSNYANTSAAWTTTNAWYSYGGNGDTWGTTWTVADVNSANFGVVISATMSGILSVVPSARVDNITMTVYYDISALAVKINSFTVEQAANNAALINWSAGSIENNTSFVIERSADGVVWHALDIVKNNAENSISNTYQYTDINPLKGQSYYRMNIVSPGSQNYFSAVEPFYIKPVQSFQIYPNPASDYIIVNNTGINSFIKITDVFGRTCEVSASDFFSGSKKINIQPLKAGIYFLNTNNNTYTFLKK
jgi:type IX secretion system substrate protein